MLTHYVIAVNLYGTSSLSYQENLCTLYWEELAEHSTVTGPSSADFPNSCINVLSEGIGPKMKLNESYPA